MNLALSRPNIIAEFSAHCPGLYTKRIKHRPQRPRNHHSTRCVGPRRVHHMLPRATLSLTQHKLMNLLKILHDWFMSFFFFNLIFLVLKCELMFCYKDKRLDTPAHSSHCFRTNMNKFIINHHRVPCGRSTELPRGGVTTAVAMDAGPFPVLLRQGHLCMVGSHVYRQWPDVGRRLAGVIYPYVHCLLVPSVFCTGSELRAVAHPGSVL